MKMKTLLATLALLASTQVLAVDKYTTMLNTETGQSELVQVSNGNGTFTPDHKFICANEDFCETPFELPEDEKPASVDTYEIMFDSNTGMVGLVQVSNENGIITPSDNFSYTDTEPFVITDGLNPLTGKPLEVKRDTCCKCKHSH